MQNRLNVFRNYETKGLDNTDIYLFSNYKETQLNYRFNRCFKK